MFRFKVPDILPTLLPGFLWRVPTQEPVLYLTFDDGPHPEVTPFVMETLQAFNAKATFFCVGENVQKYPGVYNQLLKAGHATGNHTFNHLNGWKSSLKAYEQNTGLGAQWITSSLFRPPYGRITPAQARLLQKTYTLVMWDILTRDFDPKVSVTAGMLAIKKYSRPGSILVFHDSLKAEQKLKLLLPETLTYFSDKGYRFEALPS